MTFESVSIYIIVVRVKALFFRLSFEFKILFKKII